MTFNNTSLKQSVIHRITVGGKRVETDYINYKLGSQRIRYKWDMKHMRGHTWVTH